MLLLDSKYSGILLQKEGYNFQVFLIGIFHFNSCYGSFSDTVIEKKHWLFRVFGISSKKMSAEEREQSSSRNPHAMHNCL